MSMIEDVRRWALPFISTVALTLGGAGLDANFRLRDVQGTASRNASSVQALRDEAVTAHESLRGETAVLRAEQAVQERRTALIEQKLDMMDQTLREVRADQRELLRRSE